MRFAVDKPLYVLVFSAVVSTTFTAAVMALHVATQDAVRRKEELFQQRALVELFALGSGPEGKPVSAERIAELHRTHIRRVEMRLADPQTGAVFNRRGEEGRSDGPKSFVAISAAQAGGQTNALGYAFPVWGPGFWARVDGYVALSPDLTRMLGITFLRHSETPGLGGRITEPAWCENFRGLTTWPPSAAGSHVYIGGEKPAGPTEPGYGRWVDAITGATGTSAAVERLLNERLPEMRRAALHAGLDQPPAAGEASE